MARLLVGEHSSEVLSGCCDEVRRLADTDPDSAAVIADLLLGSYREADPHNAARILQTAVRLRSSAEDWTAITLAQYAYRDHPWSHWTVAALQQAVKVATAHSRWSVAYRLLDQIESSLKHGIAIPPGRELRVETAEYALWTMHQRTATERRLLQELGRTVATSGIRDAVTRGRNAVTYLDHALTLNQTVAPGDCTELDRHTLLVRQAELEIVMADSVSSGDRLAWLRRADQTLDQTRSLWRRSPQLDATAVAMVKADLSLAIGNGEDDYAADLLAHLHQHHRWPLHRTVPEVVDIVCGRPNPRVGMVLGARIHDLVLRETEPSWRPAADPANRRRRAAYR